ncbi:MAG TPA: DUF2630 family protein [Vicinamibacteria bacterium]|nr:DUF2630 family protein [Vicinamibacteria bacterium]
MCLSVIASWTDGQVPDRIQRLAWEANGLYAKNAPAREDGERLRKIRIELDQCWTLLRRRLALPDVGRDADDAQVGPRESVESYEE